MPTHPTAALETYRPDLADALMEFDLASNQAGFVGLSIAPPLEVGEVGGVFPKIALKEMLKPEPDTRRAPGAAYGRTEGKGTTGTYACEEHGLEEAVDRREMAMYRLYWDAEKLAAERVRDAVLANHNRRVIAAALAVSTTNAAGTVWSTIATATPTANVLAGKLAMRLRLGIFPNAMVCDLEAFEYLRNCAEIVDRIKYHGSVDPAKQLSIDAVAQALGLEELIVSGAVKNSANEAQTASIASMWDRTKAFLFVRRTDKNLKRPQYMRTFHWGADDSQIGGVMESYYDVTVRGDVIRCRMDTDEKELLAAAGQVITGVLS